VTRPHLLLLAAIYALLAAHLLFIPYAFESLSLDEALSRFAELRWAPLGSDQNVAIVSRAMMFAPLGLLLAAAVTPRPGRFAWMALGVASIVGAAWSLAVNLAQLWFPARTVLPNLMVAQVAGVAGGAIAWAAFGARFRRWWQRLASGGSTTLRAALGGYVIVYLLASLAPYDFVTSGAELAEKFASDLYGLWLAPLACGPVPCRLRLLLELALAIPCGLWFALQRGSARGAVGLAFVAGFVLSLLIEGLQLLMVSGVSQGASLLTRAAGMATGAAAWQGRGALRSLDTGRTGRPLVLLLAMPYLAAVAFVAGWFRTPRASAALAAEQARDIVWMPFFYLYYTPYTAVMQSLAVHTLLYLPVGVAVWLWSKRRSEVSLGWAAALAAAISIAAETSKLLLVGRHPDYGDVLFATFAAVLSLAVLRWLSRPAAEDVVEADRQSATAAESSGPADAEEMILPAAAAGRLKVAWRLGGCLLLALALWSLALFPTGPAILGLGLATYGALLWRWPLVYLYALPAALFLLDLAPWSGRFFWDEFDLVLATTLGLRLLRQQTSGAGTRFPAFSAIALGALALSVLVSTAVAIWPPPSLDANSFSSYLSHYNALRVAKGYAWAGALLWLVASDAAVYPAVPRRLQFGLALGLLAAVAGVFWERALFVGIADLHSWFRASGLVSATHVGGAYLEMALVALTPFALSLALGAGSPQRRIFGFGMAALGAVAVLMTLSRAAFAAWLVAAALTVVFCWTRARRWQWAGVAAALLLIGVGVLLAQTTSLGVRLAQSGSDFEVRLAQWQRSLQLSGGAARAVVGLGLGSFPREFYLAYGASLRLPAYLLHDEGTPPQRHLSLNGGVGMYMDQRLSVAPGTELLLAGRVRAGTGGARLAVALCEKSLLASTDCHWAIVPAMENWQPFEVRLRVPEPQSAADGGALFVLTLSNPDFGRRVDVAALSLRESGVERLRNGDFAHGLDRWFVVSDIHLAWRALSSPVQLLVEQGVIGLAAWVLLAIAVLLRLRDVEPAEYAAAITAAAAGMAIVGLFDTVLDSPRSVVLAAMVLAGALVAEAKRSASGGG